MTPAASAFDAYHAAGRPTFDWHHVIRFHIRHGFVISTPTVFVLARYVDPALPGTHPQLIAYPGPSDTVHVWIAAGSSRLMIAECRRHAPGARVVTYLRTGRTELFSIPLHRFPAR